MMKRVLAVFLVIGTSVILLCGSAFGLAVDMTSMGPWLLAVTDGDLFNADFQVTNGTNETWTDFHLEIAGLGDYPDGLPGIPGPTAQGVYGFVDVAGGGHDGTAYDGPGTYTADAPFLGKNVDVVGISIAPGALLDFTIDTDDGESLGAYWVVAFATTDGGEIIPTPEPSTLLLLGGGLLGLAGFRRKFKV